MASSSATVAPLVLREIEGYLELIMVLADRFPLQQDTRDPIALRVLEILDQLPEENQQDAECLYYRGEALRAMKLYEEALHYLELATRQHPGQIHTWLAIGWCEKRCRRVDQAIEALQQALEVDPEDTLVQYNLACYWSLLGDVEQAVYFLGEASSNDPHYLTLIDDENDFDLVREDPRFQELVDLMAGN